MKFLLTAVLMVVVAIAAVVGYSVFRTPPEASAPIAAAPIAQTSAASSVPTTVFEIDPNASSAKFVVDEVLRGSPKTVVGATNQVAGQIALNLNDLDAAQVGTIKINARTLATDEGSRNRMLQNQILQTEQHEYITFTPTRAVGLPDTATVGQPFTFQLVGDLSIRGTSRETTFDVTVTPTAADQLQGQATTTIKYADWGVSVPKVPAVAGVDENVGLQLDFVAKTS
ncbi:MAG: YceI family protein [Chloroflexota bacterium]